MLIYSGTGSAIANNIYIQCWLCSADQAFRSADLTALAERKRHHTWAVVTSGACRGFCRLNFNLFFSPTEKPTDALWYMFPAGEQTETGWAFAPCISTSKTCHIDGAWRTLSCSTTCVAEPSSNMHTKVEGKSRIFLQTYLLKRKGPSFILQMSGFLLSNSKSLKLLYFFNFCFVLH